VPAGQESQLELPMPPAAKVPASQSVHDELPTALNEPGLHDWQPLLPASL
jgi:hypothetical protein